MKVYYNRQLIVVETNVRWALPYWAERRRLNKGIRWDFT
jgi:hypothetical protein